MSQRRKRERLTALAPPALERKGIRSVSYDRIPEECNFGTYIGLFFKFDLEEYLLSKARQRPGKEEEE